MHFAQNIHSINALWLENYFIHILHFSFMYNCIFLYFLQQYNQYFKIKELYRVNPIEAYLTGKGAVAVSVAVAQAVSVAGRGFQEILYHYSAIFHILLVRNCESAKLGKIGNLAFGEK